MSFDISTLITDRTEADRQRVVQLAQLGWNSMTNEQRAEWLTALKGAYNVEDINRINDAVGYLAQAALDLFDTISDYRESKMVAPDSVFIPPYRAEDVVVRVPATSWQQENIPTAADMETFLRNIATLRDLLGVATGTPELPTSMECLTIDGANAIEAILLAVDTIRKAEEQKKKAMIDNSVAAWTYSGEIYNGEVI